MTNHIISGLKLEYEQDMGDVQTSAGKYRNLVRFWCKRIERSTVECGLLIFSMLWCY